MSRKPAPRGATPLETTAPPLHQRPIVWVATVGALLLVMGLALRSPEEPTGPVSALPEVPEIATAPEDVMGAVEIAAEPEPAPPAWRDFTVRDGDNLSLVFARAGFNDTDLYRVAEF
ncbi:MAG: hypothetical protein VW642_10685, partial [Halieaceae bacterium]